MSSRLFVPTAMGGDRLSFEWFVYEEAESRVVSSSRPGNEHDIAGFDRPEDRLKVKTKRVIIDVQP